MWKGCWHDLVKELGDAVQHWSERSSEEAHNRTAREKVLLAFRKDVGIWECSPFPKGPGILLLESSLECKESSLDQRVRGSLQAFEDVVIRKGVLEALKVQEGAVDAQRSGPFVFIVEDGPWKEFGKLSDVVVRNVVVELLAMLWPRSVPKIFQVTCRDSRNAISLMPLDKGFL